MKDLAERHAEAQVYVDRIRNSVKRDYAVRYLEWLRNGAGPEPRTRALSYVTAQAVRMRLLAHWRGDGPSS